MSIAKEHNEKLQAARAEALKNGKSPRKIGQEKAAKALLWVYKWGWSTPAILEILAGGQRSGIATRLVKRGWLEKTRTADGGYARDKPAFILTLTTSGVEEVEKNFNDERQLLNYNCNPLKVNQQLLRHDMMCQSATAKALAKGSIVGFKTESEIRQEARDLIKISDAIWVHTDGTKTAIEVELSAKWNRDLDQFLWGCIRGLAGDQPAFNRLAIVSDSDAILKRYKAALSPGAALGSWEREPGTNRWIKTRTERVPAWTKGRVLCKSFSHA